MAKTEHVVWGDAEATGLDPYTGDHLVEVGILVTDTNLNILDEEGYSSAIYYPERYVEMMKTRTDEYVLDMHEKTGLWDRLSTEGKPLSTVDSESLEYIKQFVKNPRTAWLGGNSITLDRKFFGVYLPNMHNYLHYRSLDVTSWAGPFQWWKKEQFRKRTEHSAMSDIRESIDEMKFLRDLALR